MRILRNSLFMLTSAVLILAVKTKNVDNDCDGVDLNDEGKVIRKLSTTLKIDNKTFKSIPDHITRGTQYVTDFSLEAERESDSILTTDSTSPLQKCTTRNLKDSKIPIGQTPSSVAVNPHFHLGNYTTESSRKKSTSEDSDKANKDESFEDVLEELPEAHELRYERTEKRKYPYRRYTLRKRISMNRRNVFPEISHPSLTKSPRRPTDPKRGPTVKECTFFTKTVCLEVNNYPIEAIMRSIRSNKEMITALLADYKLQEAEVPDDEILPTPIFNRYQDNHESKYGNRFESNELKRRSDYPVDNVEEGFTCPSQVKYARPQLARAASGVWKYIINTDEHTQTLRLEKCSSTQSSCSFISENYRSSCVQVYNYHRLLTWDAKLGLHMDIFKVPTCCSCHVHGYSEIYPPHQKDPPSKMKESFPGAVFSIKDQKNDFDEVGKPSNYVNKYSPASYFETLGLFDDHLSTSFSSEDDFSITKPKTSIIDASPNRSIYNIPGRKHKKPSSVSRPYDKLPQHHAPNTRAPGYTGSFSKSTRSKRPNRPYRRESTSEMEDSEAGNNATNVNRSKRPSHQDENSKVKKQNGYVDDAHEPQKRVNYNYHPIIDFFKPQASMLQTEVQVENEHPSSMEANSDTWRPIVSS